MAKKVRIKWNLSGFEDVRRSPEVRAIIGEKAEAIAEACGEGYVAETSEGKTRSRAAVITATPRAMNHNRKHNAILKNLRATS